MPRSPDPLYPSPWPLTRIPKRLHDPIPVVPDWRRFCGFGVPITRDIGDHVRSRRSSLPNPSFFNSCCKQNHLFHSRLGRPLRGAWVALGWPKRDPRVTQSQTQSQSAESADGRLLTTKFSKSIVRHRTPGGCFILPRSFVIITRELVHHHRSCLLRPTA